MSPVEDDLRECAIALEDHFAHAYAVVSGGAFSGDLLLQDVLYRLLATGVIEVGPALSKDIPL